MKNLLQPASMLTATLLLLAGCYANDVTTSSTPPMQQEAQEVTITIDQLQRISLDGEQVTLFVLENKLAEMAANAKLRVTVRVASETPMGLVSDVQQLIPASAEIFYPLPEE